MIHLSVSGQYYDIGQSPASLKWEKIESGDFSIIYPAGYYGQAKLVLASFEAAGGPVATGLNASPRPTPLVLHTQSAISNAYAIWAPARIEILATPPQDLYAQPWIQQLALHEYRHIVQLSSINQGITKSLGYLFGQQAAVVSTGLFIPRWFLEGDAVATETALSYSGRGRVPSFTMPLRAQLAEKGLYSYPKASLGSYRDYVPDIYCLGYHIVSASRMKYGPDLWKEAMNSVARKPWTVTPFNRGLKKHSGLNKRGLYHESVRTLNELWGQNNGHKTQQALAAKKHTPYVNYLHPHRISDSMTVALKTSLSRTPKIVRIDRSGNEEAIHAPGYVMNELISFGGGLIAWAEYRPHVRWETRNYAEIVILDPATGKTQRIGQKSKFYAPVVSPDGNSVAAIEYGDYGECFLTIIRENTLNRLTIPAGIHAATPAWSPDCKTLVYVATGNHGKAIAQISIDNGETEYLTPFTFSEISNPFHAGEVIYYTGTAGETSQIFSLDLTDGKISQHTNAIYGADNAAVINDSLLYNVYSADGYRIEVISLTHNTGLSPAQHGPAWPLAETLSEQEPAFRFTDSLPDVEYSRSAWSKAGNLFKFHSWAPLFVDISGETVRPGVSVMSQNLLSTMFITAGYDYNLQEEAGMFKADIAWKGWYPVIKAAMSGGIRASSKINEEGHSPEQYTWQETNLDLSISQNLNFSKGAFNSGLSGELGYNYKKISHNSSTPDDFIKGNLSGLSYRIFSYGYSRMAYRDLGPRFGYNFGARYRHTPFGQLKAGNIIALQTQIFLPGFYANHSLLLYTGYQVSNPETYRFADIISISRGYNIIIKANNLLSMKIAYRLPLLYPDLHLGGLLFVKRIRANVFYDFTRASGAASQEFYNSSGIDLVSDLHLFGLSIPISAGIRTVYREKDGAFTSSFLFTMNFYEY